MKFTQIPADTFEKLVLNAGILVDNFTPDSGVIGNILGATSGGITFATNPEFVDYGEDVDNAPKNVKEFKKLVGYDPVLSGNFLTVDADMVKMLVGAADVSGTKVTPRNELLAADFTDVWWIGDYSDKNTGDNAGYLAVHVKNALNTSGIQITSSKDAKGQLAFEFHGHYSVDSIDEVPFEIFCKAGA